MESTVTLNVKIPLVLKLALAGIANQRTRQGGGRIIQVSEVVREALQHYLAEVSCHIPLEDNPLPLDRKEPEDGPRS